MTTFDVNSCTVQEACDYVVEKLVLQGEPCVLANTREDCVYGDGKGNHCAVGWLLDAENEELMDFMGSVHELIQYHGALIPEVITKNKGVFYALQKLHDEKALSNSPDLAIASILDAKTTLKNHKIKTTSPRWKEFYGLFDLNVEGV